MGQLLIYVSLSDSDVEGKKNVVADALSRKPQVSAVSISYHHELDDMKTQYVDDEDYARIYNQLSDGQ